MSSKNLTINNVADRAVCSEKVAATVLGALAEEILFMLRSGQEVSLPGVGTFKAVKKPAREVRNPMTGERQMAQAKMTAKFTFGTKAKARIQQ